jgi:protein-arginine kinase activator protein McsA
MTEKEMQKLTDMILDGLEERQAKLDNEFYANLDNRTDIAYTPHQINIEQNNESEKERVLNKLHDLYGMQLQLIEQEKYELAEEVKQTIKAIKESFKF